MKSTGRKWFSLAFATSLGLALTSQAAAIDKTPLTQPAQKQPQRQQGPKPAKLPPDLVCSITAYLDKGGTKPIANGGSFSTSTPVGTLQVWVRFNLTNKGPGNIPNINGTMWRFNYVVSRNGATVKNHTQDIVSAPNAPKKGAQAVWVHQTVDVNLPGGINKIEAKFVLDTLNQIAEVNEGNNTCSFNFTVTVKT